MSNMIAVNSMDTKLSNEFASNKSRLPWPLGSAIADRFGKHRHPVYGSIEKMYHYDPYGEVVYESISSGPVNLYQYSGKEWDDKQKAYDFSARMYMPSYARFTTMDPLCEQDPGRSPYLYCAGNPVNLVDPDGTNWYSTTDESGNAIYLYVEGQMTDDEIKQGGYEDLGYTFSDNESYYSLFGQIIPYNQSQTGAPLAQMYENIDRLIITFFNCELDNDLMSKKTDMSLDGYYSKVIGFSYKGNTFHSIKGVVSGSKNVGEGTIYYSVLPENSKAYVTRIPDKKITIPSYNRKFTGYWLTAANGLGAYEGFSILQIKFDYQNAVNFINSVNNLFGKNYSIR